MMSVSRGSKKKKDANDDDDEEEEEGDDLEGRRKPSSSSCLANLSEFFRLYVLDWRTLAALAVPAAFCLAFPVYWLALAPRVWTGYPGLHRPREWLLAYWVFAAVVWSAFLVVCFYRSRFGNCSIVRTNKAEPQWNSVDRGSLIEKCSAIHMEKEFTYCNLRTLRKSSDLSRLYEFYYTVRDLYKCPL